MMISMAPLILILMAAGSVIMYHSVLQISLGYAAQAALIKGQAFDARSLLRNTDLSSVPNSTSLCVSFLSIFICSEIAFVLMALRDYLQDLLGFTDEQLMPRNLLVGASNDHTEQGTPSHTE